MSCGRANRRQRGFAGRRRASLPQFLEPAESASWDAYREHRHRQPIAGSECLYNTRAADGILSATPKEPEIRPGHIRARPERLAPSRWLSSRSNLRFDLRRRQTKVNGWYRWPGRLAMGYAGLFQNFGYPDGG